MLAADAILDAMSDSDERPRLEINWVQSSGAALAAVSSAVLLSTFGVAGTLIGAAVGSLVITVGGALYTYSIKATRQRVAMAQTVATARIGLAQARVRNASDAVVERRPGAADAAAEDMAEAEVDLDHARTLLEDELDDADDRPPWRSVLRGLPWKRIGMGALATFVVAMVVIVAFELVTGRAVSSYTGGSDSDQRTSIPGLGGGGDPQETPGEQPSETPSQDVEEDPVLPPEEESDEVEPTVEPTATPTATTPTATPTVETEIPETTEVPTPETSPTP